MKSLNVDEQWIGSVPAHWGVSRLGSHFTERRATISADDFEPLSVTMQGIVPQLANAAKSDATDNRKLVRSGDFVINSRSDRKGSGGISTQDGSVSQISIVLEPKGLNSRFTHYLLTSYPFQEEFYRWGTGIVADLWSTRFSSMKQIKLPVPPLDEQKAIADFLDRELAQIDVLIEKQMQVVEQIELRQRAMVSELLAQGLNRSTELVSSNAPWGSLIPKEWRCVPLWTVANLVKSSNRGMMEENLLSLSYGKVVRRSLDAVDGLLPESFETYQIVDPNDEVFRLTDLQNDMKSLRSGLVRERGIITSAYLAVRLSDDLDAEYFDLLMRAYDLMKVFYGMGSGLRQTLNWQEFRRLPIYLPPIVEQKVIADKCKESASKAEQQMDTCSKAIQVLKERRQSIIAAAVTGKIDVRKVA